MTQGARLTMTRENSKLRNKRRDKRALERAIIRTLRVADLDKSWTVEGYKTIQPGTLRADVQATLYGLEKARRAL